MTDSNFIVAQILERLDLSRHTLSDSLSVKISTKRQRGSIFYRFGGGPWRKTLLSAMLDEGTIGFEKISKWCSPRNEEVPGTPEALRQRIQELEAENAALRMEMMEDRDAKTLIRNAAALLRKEQIEETK